MICQNLSKLDFSIDQNCVTDSEMDSSVDRKALVSETYGSHGVRTIHGRRGSTVHTGLH